LAEHPQPTLRANPHRKIDNFALMPNLDSGASELAETWHFLPQGFGHRADHGDGLDLLEGHQRVRDDIRGSAKILLLAQQVSILLRDLGAPHRSLQQPCVGAACYHDQHAASELAFTPYGNDTNSTQFGFLPTG
jgi:hypothetical protein